MSQDLNTDYRRQIEDLKAENERLIIAARTERAYRESQVSMISTPAPEHNDSFGEAHKHSRVSSIERVGFTETSFSKEQRSPIQVRRNQKVNPE